MTKEKKRKIIVWNMTYGCNYNCSECFQPYSKDKHPSKQLFFKIIDELASNFPENSLIKITGGEVFSIPNFIDEIVSYLVKKTKFKFTITTNLSFPVNTYYRFLKKVDARIERLSASWHNEYLPANEFIEKVLKIRNFMNKNNQRSVILKINLILIPVNFPQLKIIKKKLKQNNIKLHFQTFRIGRFGRKFYKYTIKEEREINKLVEDFSPMGYNNKRHYQGRVCRAGIDYFVINPTGDVYTCHEAYELGKNGACSLGNLADGTFSYLKKENFCPYDYCTVPEVAIKKIVKNEGK